MAVLLFILYFGSWTLYITFVGLVVTGLAGVKLSDSWNLLVWPMAIITVVVMVLSALYYGVKDTLAVVIKQYISKAWYRFVTVSFIAGMLIFVTHNSRKYRNEPSQVVEYHRRQVCGFAGLGVAMLAMAIVHMQGMLSFNRLKLK